MTTTVRSVRVELEAAVAGYIRDIKLAGHETDRAFSGIEAKVAGANRSIGNLDKSTSGLARTSAEAKVQQTGLADSVDKTGRAAGRAEKSIDRYSGRLRLLTDLALIGGPALLRLGAGALPAVSAGLVGIGAAAGGIGVTVLAVSGLKDALKALNDYELERTPENLQAARVELERLGPAGAHFVQYLNDLGPVLQGLQRTARAGIFPEWEDGIDDALTRLPIVQAIVRRLSNEVGQLGAETGAAIASDRLSPFLKYIRDEGAPALDAFAHSAGNVALGLANIVVAFDPATQDFLDGMVDGTERFAKATEHLDENERFQAFLSEVREAGPEVIDFLGSAVDLMIGLAHASAPFGRVALPALTGVANAFAAIAKSPIGPPLYTAAAALLLFNRAASLTSRASTGLTTSLDRLGGKVTTTKDKLFLLGARGGVVLAGAAAVATLADSINRIDTENLDRSLTALQFGNVTGTIDKVVDSLSELTATRNKVDLGEIVTVGGLLGDSSLDKFADNIDQVDQSLAQLVESGRQAEAADLFRKITDLAAAKGVSPEETARRFDAYALALDNVAAASSRAAGSSDGLRSLLGGVERELNDAAEGAQAFSDALSDLNGWLDKREALRGYREGIHELGKALHDGFQHKDAETIDAVGRNISQVASLIKDRDLRADFLAGARASLVELAEKSGPKAKREVQELIGALDRYGLTKPPSPKLDVDDKPAKGKIRGVKGYLEDLVGHPYTAAIHADGGSALNVIGAVQRALNNLRDKSITVRVNQIGGVTSSAGGHSVDPGADGMTVPGPRHPYGDKVLIKAAPGEEIISNRHGQADRFRSDRAAGRIPSYAAGGEVPRIYTSRSAFDPGGPTHFMALGAATDHVTRGLKGLEAQLDKVRSSYEKEKSKLDDLISSRSSLASSIASSALHDPFGNGLAGLDAQVEADSADLDAMTTALATLVKNGLSPKSALYQQLAAHMDVTTAQQLAQLSSADLASKAQRFDAVQGQADAFGQGVAGGQFNEAIRDNTRVNDRLERRLHELQQAIHDLKDLPKHVKQGTKEGASEGAAFGTEKGTRAANDERNRRVAAGRRTGS